MADRQEVFSITAPANTAQSTPVERGLAFTPGKVVEVELRIAKGHASLTGIQLAYGRTVIVPRTSGGWITGDDRTITLRPGDAGDSGQWSAFVYNTDNRDHYWSVTFDINEIAPHLIYPLPEPNFHDPAPFITPVDLGSSIRWPSYSPSIPAYDARWTPGAPVDYGELTY